MTRSVRALLLPAALGAATTLLHLLTAGRGGYFRDELYYLACSDHLGLGYVDHPPLIGWITWLGRSILGDSLVAIRLLPALAGGLTVFLAALMARELRGGRFAQVLAAACTALAPVYVGTFGFLSMNAFDVLIWAAAMWTLIRLLRTGDSRLWLAFGLVAGLGLENKLSIGFLGVGVVGGLVLARRWKMLTDRYLWLGGLVALALFLPHLIWQWVHGWPTLEFMSNATRHKNLPLAPVEFLGEQLLLMNPLVAPLFVAGLAFLLFSPRVRAYRPLGFAVLVVLALMITQRSKAYYFSPIYTLLFASGGVVVADLAGRRGLGWVRPAALALVVTSGLLLAPLGKPVLSVESYVAYAERLGVAPSTSERKEIGRLPQFFADRVGWPELASSVSEVYESLPPEDRSRACVFGQNYGQAGAVDFFGRDHGLPPALSGHNSYHLWGTRGCSGEVLIVLGDRRERLEELFESVDLGSRYTCRDCMPYESDKPIWVCRNMRLPVDKLWPRIKHFD